MSDSDEGEREEIIHQFMAVTNEDEAFSKSYLQQNGWKVKRSLNSYFEEASGKRLKPSEDEDEDGDIPEVAVCQKLVEEFVGLTNTDEACAQFYLQDRQWDLQRSVNAYFEAKMCTGMSSLNDGDEPELVVNINKNMVKQMNSMTPSTELPTKFKLITWNIDGLDKRNLKLRTKAVSKVIKMENADVVFLQEVIPETYRFLETHLPDYMCIAGNNVEYFTAMCLKRSSVIYDEHYVRPFPNSTMGRNLIIAKVHIGGVPMKLITSHLESTKDGSSERVGQLKTAFSDMNDTENDCTVIFGGDLNLRDKELSDIGGIPRGIEDLWISCGQREECSYTWDAVRNVNIEMAGRYRPRLRFDRVYIRHAHKPSVKTKHFGFVGIQKIQGAQCFPSDHWGINVIFDLK